MTGGHNVIVALVLSRVDNMKNLFKHLVLPVVLGLSSLAAQAANINFDELAATDNNSPYTTSLFGVTFGGTNSGTFSGLTAGDPGNWGLEGTNGTNFLGFNGINGYSEVVSFATSVNNFSVDVSRSNGSVDGTLTFNAFNGSTLLGSSTYSLGPINSWTTVSLNYAAITSVSWTGTGSGFHPYAVDNMSFNVTAVPEAETYAMMLAGLGVMGAIVRRRKAKLTA